MKLWCGGVLKYLWEGEEVERRSGCHGGAQLLAAVSFC